MELKPRRLDADQHRRRLRLLADVAQAKAVRLRGRFWAYGPGGARTQPIRELVVRRRPVR